MSRYELRPVPPPRSTRLSQLHANITCSPSDVQRFPFPQLAKDCEALKAQATSLLGELNERQSCLEKSERERKVSEEK